MPTNVCRIIVAFSFPIALAAAPRVEAQALPASTPEHGAFAFPDRSGTRLVATPFLSQPALLTTALCSGGRRLAVQFDRRQERSRKTTHRQTPANYENTPGAVFKILGTTIDPASTSGA